MIIKEVKKDLFTMPNDYALAHCISADFKLGAGIARKFDELFDARQIKTKYTTTLNPIDKEDLEKAMAELNEIQQNNKSLELAKLFVKLYENELKHIGECYETNHHSS